jgi:hypothetical protein
METDRRSRWLPSLLATRPARWSTAAVTPAQSANGGVPVSKRFGTSSIEGRLRMSFDTRRADWTARAGAYGDSYPTPGRLDSAG